MLLNVFVYQTCSLKHTQKKFKHRSMVKNDIGLRIGFQTISDNIVSNIEMILDKTQSSSD